MVMVLKQQQQEQKNEDEKRKGWTWEMLAGGSMNGGALLDPKLRYSSATRKELLCLCRSFRSGGREVVAELDRELLAGHVDA